LTELNKKVSKLFGLTTVKSIFTLTSKTNWKYDKAIQFHWSLSTALANPLLMGKDNVPWQTQGVERFF